MTKLRIAHLIFIPFAVGVLIGAGRSNILDGSVGAGVLCVVVGVVLGLLGLSVLIQDAWS